MIISGTIVILMGGDYYKFLLTTFQNPIFPYLSPAQTTVLSQLGWIAIAVILPQTILRTLSAVTRSFDILFL